MHLPQKTALAFDLVLAPTRVVSRRQAFHFLSEAISEFSTCPARLIFDVLMDRERLAPSGIGRGVAIPHARLPNLSGPVLALLRLTQPLSFDAIDSQPVDLITVLLSPETETATHLSRLSRVSRMMRDKELCARLRMGETADALRAILMPQAPFDRPQAA